MKPADEIERRITHTNETTSRDMDERVIKDIRHAMADSPCEPLRWPAKLLAGAAVVIFTLLIVTQFSREPEPPRGPRATLSVGEMVSVKHLNMAYRRGGMQAIDALCEEAADRVDLRSGRMSLGDLMAELNGI